MVHRMPRNSRRLAILIACLVFLVSAFARIPVARAQTINTAPARPRDLFADAGSDHFWIGRVLRDPVDNSTQTLIVYRGKLFANSDWTTLSVVPERVVSMAADNDELLLVLANGQWEIADDTDIRSGPTSEGWETMLTIAGSEDAVWAIVRYAPPTTQESAEQETTAPSTEPATQPEIPARLMICEFTGGKWTDPEPIPDDVQDDPAQIAMTVANGLPMLAWRRPDGKLTVSQLSATNQWSAPVTIQNTPPDADFKLLTINDRGVLWVAPALPTTRPSTQASPNVATIGGAGDVLIGPDFLRRVTLGMPRKIPGDVGSQTLVAAFGNLRWLGYAGDQQIEQDYSLDRFPESFPAANPMSVSASPKPPVIPLTPWIGGDAVLLLLAGLAAIRQRNLPAPEADPAQPPAKPRLAPIGVRFVAGLVDLAPILAVVAILHPANAANPLANIDQQSLEILGELAVATYILHILVAELICGQSIGKLVFGLKVMSSDGTPPKPWAIVLRNILRVFDVALLGFSLLIVFINPLRQRVGDLISGTVVVGGDGDEEEDDD
jgi:uncharacterized RDD family membrane protein YckC